MRIPVGMAVVALVLVPVLGASTSDAAVASAECPNPTVSGTPGDDVLQGTPGPDVIDAGDGNDQVDGLGGNDVICGGEGSDILLGGEGDDAIYGGIDDKQIADTDYYEYVGDSLTGGPGADRLDGGADTRRDEPGDSLSYAAAPAAVVLDLTVGVASGGDGTDQLVGAFGTTLGSAYDDQLVGSARDDVLIGSGGRDTIDGRGGSDTVVGGSYGEGAEDRVGNVLSGGGGGDYVTGSKGDDVLLGGPGGDTLDGGRGRDRLDGQEGDDQLVDLVEGVGQTLRGGAGHDILGEIYFYSPVGRFMTKPVGRIDLTRGFAKARQRGATASVLMNSVEDAVGPPAARWTIIGNGRNNQLLSDLETPTHLLGRGGNDQLAGSDRDDVLDGGSGRDEADGYAGRDRYVSIEKRRRSRF